MTRLGLIAPAKHQTGRNPIAPRHRSHCHTRCKTLLDNPRLVLKRPAPPPFHPSQNLRANHPDDLKYDLKVTFSQITTPSRKAGQAGRLRLQQPIDRNLRDKITFRVGEARGQPPWRQLGFVQRQLRYLTADGVGDAVPDAAGRGERSFRGVDCQSATAVAPFQQHLNLASVTESGGIAFGHCRLPVGSKKMLSYPIPAPWGTSLLKWRCIRNVKKQNCAGCLRVRCHPS